MAELAVPVGTIRSLAAVIKAAGGINHLGGASGPSWLGNRVVELPDRATQQASFAPG